MSLWDDVLRGAQSVVDESQRLARLAKLTAETRSLEGQLGELVGDLGTRVLELHRRNELYHVELDKLFVEIEALQQQLREKEAEAAALKGRPPGPRGAELPERCPDCGEKTTERDRFCRHCGLDLRT